MSKLTEYLCIPEEYVEAFESSSIAIMEDEGSRGEVIYGYYFDVPDDLPEELLEIMNWEVDQRIDDIPVWAVEEDEYDESDFDDQDIDYDELDEEDEY